MIALMLIGASCLLMFILQNKEKKSITELLVRTVKFCLRVFKAWQILLWFSFYLVNVNYDKYKIVYNKCVIKGERGGNKVSFKIIFCLEFEKIFLPFGL